MAFFLLRQTVGGGSATIVFAIVLQKMRIFECRYVGPEMV